MALRVISKSLVNLRFSHNLFIYIFIVAIITEFSYSIWSNGITTLQSESNFYGWRWKSRTFQWRSVVELQWTVPQHSAAKNAAAAWTYTGPNQTRPSRATGRKKKSAGDSSRHPCSTCRAGEQRPSQGLRVRTHRPWQLLHWCIRQPPPLVEGRDKFRKERPTNPQESSTPNTEPAVAAGSAGHELVVARLHLDDGVHAVAETVPIRGGDPSGVVAEGDRGVVGRIGVARKPEDAAAVQEASWPEEGMEGGRGGRYNQEHPAQLQVDARCGGAGADAAEQDGVEGEWDLAGSAKRRGAGDALQAQITVCKQKQQQQWRDFDAGCSSGSWTSNGSCEQYWFSFGSTRSNSNKTFTKINNLFKAKY